MGYLDHLAQWVGRFGESWAAVAFGVACLITCFYRGPKNFFAFAAAVMMAGVFGLAVLRVETIEPIISKLLFTKFAGLAVLAAVLMIVEKNPVYAALYFALVVLSGCGVFLLLAGAFLAAATIIVYAGAIIVTFLFVIMLAQQRGQTLYDRTFWNPLPAALTGGLLLGTILVVLQQQYRGNSSVDAVITRLEQLQQDLIRPASNATKYKPPTLLGYPLDELLVAELDKQPNNSVVVQTKRELLTAQKAWREAWQEPLPPPPASDEKAISAIEKEIGPGKDQANLLAATLRMQQSAAAVRTIARARPTTARGLLADQNRLLTSKSYLGTPNADDNSLVRVLGRSLWTDYLLAVELAGTLLLVATLGTIAINDRRKEVHQ